MKHNSRHSTERTEIINQRMCDWWSILKQNPLIPQQLDNNQVDEMIH